MKKAFTLLELVIVITVVGILSLLLFRTVGDMMRANARIQQEKILSQELITLQTTLNHLAEIYPYIDYSKYSSSSSQSGTLLTDDGIATILHLTNDPDPQNQNKKTISISDQCPSPTTPSSQATQWDNSTLQCLSYTNTSNPKPNIQPKLIAITNPHRTVVKNIKFKLLPTQPYKYNQYEADTQLNTTTISHPGFWLIGELSHASTNTTPAKTAYQLQHFINLKYKHFDQTNNQTSTTAQ